MTAPRGARWAHTVRAVPRGTTVEFYAVKDGVQHGPFPTAEQARKAKP